MDWNASNFGQTLKSMPIPSPDQAAQWQELALELRRQEATEWPTLRDSLAVNETRAFATSFSPLARRRNCAPLATYAAALTTFADAYAIGQMERHLAAFPKLIESIETSWPRPNRNRYERMSHALAEMNSSHHRNKPRLPARRR